jgi:folate-binding protein YgfZ
MLAAWREHLRSDGTDLAPKPGPTPEIAATQADLALHGDVIADLSHRGVISVSGPDARSLLQGQLTNDIEAVDEGHTQLSAWCSIKGRVLALFRIWLRDEAHCLELPAELRDPIITRLRMYVLRARVTIADDSEGSIRFGVSGPKAAEALAAEVGPLPARPDEACRSRHSTVVRLRGEGPRFQVIAPFEEAVDLWAHCRAHAAPVAGPAWRILDIRAGIASLPPLLGDRFLPQMLNLQSVNGMSFEKGCYAGQEIVARTQYLGRLKRRLHRAVLDTPEPAAPGDPLYRRGGDREGPVGQVVVAAPSPRRQRFEVLAVVADDAAAEGNLALGAPEGPALELLPLPYRSESEAA